MVGLLRSLIEGGATMDWRVDADAIVASHLGRSVGGRALVDDIGFRPIYAAIYQFVVLAMIFAASGLTALVSTLLIRSEAFTAAEQLLLRPGPVSA